MNTNVRRKQDYIRITGEILEQEGRAGVSIRRIAELAGCSSAVLYKHFESLEHLIMLACVRFLEPYMRRMGKVSARKDLSPIQINLVLWQMFLREAFANKTYYEMMFVSTDKDRLRACVQEYYQIFADVFEDADPVSMSILFSNSVREREMVQLKRAAAKDLISPENAELLSRLTEAVFAGSLAQYHGSPDDEEQLREAEEESYQLILDLYEKYCNRMK